MKNVLLAIGICFLAYSCTVTVEPEFDPHSPQNQQVEMVPMVAYYTATGHLIRTDYLNSASIWVYPDQVYNYPLSYPQNNPCGCGDPIFWWKPI